MSQNFCLLHVSNLSVRNFRIFCSCIRGSGHSHAPRREGGGEDGQPLCSAAAISSPITVTSCTSGGIVMCSWRHGLVVLHPSSHRLLDCCQWWSKGGSDSSMDTQDTHIGFSQRGCPISKTAHPGLQTAPDTTKWSDHAARRPLATVKELIYATLPKGLEQSEGVFSGYRNFLLPKAKDI